MVVISNNNDDVWSASMVRPVLLGDSGEAMMGAGNVRRFRYVGVLY
jgi:hypothetical protein